MGACYSVEIRPKFKNEKEFCDIIHRICMSYRLYGVGSCEFKTPEECINFLCFGLAEQQYDGTWFAEFEAAYMYEQVLIDVFTKAAEVLDDGSDIFITIDDETYQINVVNENIVTVNIVDDWEESDEVH